MHIVEALEHVPDMRCVLCLFEGVVTGAADGYARMAGKPACTLLHLGPGLANGLANLHNASRAHVPIINVVGQHATYHLRHDTPLVSDIEAIAKPCSRWLRTSSAVSKIGHDAAEAIVAARTAPGQIATLIVPADIAWNEGALVAEAPNALNTPMPPADAIEHAAGMLCSGARTALLLAGSALFGDGLAAASIVGESANVKLLAPYPFTRMQRGSDVVAVERVAYVLEQAVEQLKEFRQIILVGASALVSYFASPGKESVLTSPECEVHTLTKPGEDHVGALKALAAALSKRFTRPAERKSERPLLPKGDISLAGLAATVGALLPENAIVVDESMTSGRGMMAATQGAPSHDWLANTGGSIGIAMPLAVGASVACPGRKVLCLSADGSGMYTAQALWTMSRESLPVTTVIFANREYAVLKREFSYLGVGEPGPRARDMFEIGRPDLDWVSLAKGMGVPGTRIQSLDGFAKALREGFESGGPALIEVRL